MRGLVAKFFFGQKCGLVGQCGTVLEKCGRSTPSGKRGEVGRHCGFTAVKFCRNASVNSYLVLIATDVSFYSGRVFPKTYDGTPKRLKNRLEVL